MCFFARGFWDEGITQQERELSRPAAGIHKGSLLKGNTEGLIIICRIIDLYTRIREIITATACKQ